MVRRISLSLMPTTLLLALALASPALAGGGILYAPNGADEGDGVALELYRVDDSGRLQGGALWFAGSVAPSPDVDTTIPHWDFWTKEYESRWGLLYLFGRRHPERKVTFIGGAGLAVVEKEYIDVSNVTGWTWDGGSDTKVELQGQVGLLVGSGHDSGLRIGYDTQFGAFAGLAFRFK